MLRELSGCWTAVVTPLRKDFSIDWEGFETNIDFQDSAIVSGVVLVGTTGESPTLTEKEQGWVISKMTGFINNNVYSLLCIAGCGSNSTEKAIHLAEVAGVANCDGILLVDPYYNGPSSLEIREEYYRKIARRFRDIAVIPYIIPGRTGCELLAVDLAILARKCPNIVGVKEATGNFERMRLTRRLTKRGFQIVSGDDDKTFGMMTDPEIKAAGVISVISNVAPHAIQRMCNAILRKRINEAQHIRDALSPLFGVVTVTQKRVEMVRGQEVEVADKFRNPLPIKTMMQGLGMPAGPCRPPLGKMTFQGVVAVRDALIQVWEKNPWVLEPIEDHYEVSVRERLENDAIWQKLAY